MKIETYQILFNNSLMYINIQESFLDKIKFLISRNYESLREFNEKHLRINYPTLKHEFNRAKYHPSLRLLKIAKIFNLDTQELFDNVIGFRYLGSHRKKPVFFPREIDLNENFVEGFALYLAEGDTGFNGKTVPRKLRLSNSNLDVIQFFLLWLMNHFSNINFYLDVILPESIAVPGNIIEETRKRLGITNLKIKIRKGYYNKKTKYNVCCNNAILIDFILYLNEKIKRACLQDKNLMKAYIKGMMAGEGTVYFNKSRYVRIEMKNEREIKYIHKLFQILGFSCEPSLRTEREGMWSLYIGAKQLKKFYGEIGFGAQKERQEILKKAANKKLRINQYV